MHGQRDQLLGVLLILISVGLIAVVDVAAKFLTAEFHAIQIVWGYFLSMFLHILVYSAIRRRNLRLDLATRRLPLHLGRTALLIVSTSSLFVGLKYLPLADTMAINFVSPLFMAVLAVRLLGEKVGLHRWLAVIVGLGGVLIIVRPGGGMAHWAAVMPLISALAFAIYQIVIRILARTETTFATLFYTAAGALLWSSLVVGFVWHQPTLMHWAVFLGLGSLGVAAHLALIKAFELAQASLLAPFNYTKIVWGAFFGYVVFSDIPSLNTLIGCAVIIASGLYVLMGERKPSAAI